MFPFPLINLWRGILIVGGVGWFLFGVVWLSGRLTALRLAAEANGSPAPGLWQLLTSTAADSGVAVARHRALRALAIWGGIAIVAFVIFGWLLPAVMPPALPLSR